MLNIRTILVPTDLSERAERAIEHAAALASHFSAKLICAHVVAPAPHEYQLLGMGLAPEMSAENVERLSKQLRSLSATAAPACDLETVIREGDPAHQIEQLVAERKVDLAVMTTHGYGRFRRMLLGSIAAKVLHDVTCPILTGAHLTDKPLFRTVPYKTVACALALRDLGHSAKVLRWAADFAKSWSAGLHVIHVPPAIDWSAGEWFPDETQQLVREASREKLDALLADAGCEASVHTEGMEAVAYVAEVVREVGADALIVGRSVEHGLLGGGSDAFAMIRESPCPVISV
jgi:nucleotide-binding universal stress UspA family protein